MVSGTLKHCHCSHNASHYRKDCHISPWMSHFVWEIHSSKWWNHSNKWWNNHLLNVPQYFTSCEKLYLELNSGCRLILSYAPKRSETPFTVLQNSCFNPRNLRLYLSSKNRKEKPVGNKTELGSWGHDQFRTMSKFSTLNFRPPVLSWSMSHWTSRAQGNGIGITAKLPASRLAEQPFVHHGQ